MNAAGIVRWVGGPNMAASWKMSVADRDDAGRIRT